MCPKFAFQTKPAKFDTFWPISNIFPQKKPIETCSCGMLETMEHIYTCEKTNINNREKMSYEEIYSNDISKQIEISRVFFENLEKR